jgi:hypothetical protein
MVDNTRGLMYDHPYRDLPDFECHIAPLYAVINAGPKCIDLDLDQVALDYHQSEMSDSQMEPKRQLEPLRDIWALFENAKEAAKAWEETEREERCKAKRKREENDTDTYSLTTKRTTRLQSHSENGAHEGLLSLIPVHAHSLALIRTSCRRGLLTSANGNWVLLA